MTNKMAQIETRVAQILARFAKQKMLLGAAVGVIAGQERVALSEGLALVGSARALSVDDRFQVGCVAKLALSLKTHELADAGSIDLARPITFYLPELRDTALDAVQVRHLLAHTSGYQPENIFDPDVRFSYSWEQFVSYLRQTPLLFGPGKVFNYVHSGPVILGELLRRLTDQSPSAIINEVAGSSASCDEQLLVQGHVFHPREKQYTKAERADLADFWEASLAGPALSVRHLTRIGEALLHRLLAAGPNETEHGCVELPTLFGGQTNEETPVAFGPGFARYRSGLYGLSAAISGQACAIRVDPANRSVIAVAVNSYQPGVRDRLLARVCWAVRNQTHEFDELELTELVGFYQGAQDSRWQALMEDGNLVLRRANNAASTRKPAQGIVMQKNEHGRVVPVSGKQAVPVGFFLEPESRTPCFMVGTLSYKRVSDAQRS